MKLRTILVMLAVLVVLGGAYLLNRPRPAPPAPTRLFVWQVGMTDLAAMVIDLPRVGKREAWVVHPDGYWYFDAPNGSKVDMKRWGGGIPLLLSGPGAGRVIEEDPTDEQLATYGLDKPHMEIHLQLKNGDLIDVRVGDLTPGAKSYYIKVATAKSVYTVDSTWYDVLARLVLAPPYPPQE